MNRKILFVMKAISRFSLALVICSNMVSCSNSSRSLSVTPAEQMMQEIVESQVVRSLEVPDAVSDALLEPSYTQNSSAKVETRFNVSVNEVPARTFFVSLVSDTGVNVVAHPEIAGSISLELRNVTIDDVLDVTREVYGYEYKFSNNIYTIFPRKIRTEIFPVDYLDVLRVGVTDISVQIGKISSGNDNGGGSGGRSGGGSNDSSGGSNLLSYLDDNDNSSGVSGGQEIMPGARIQTLTKTNFWGGINAAILAIVGDGPGRMVMTNPQSGLVVVKAMPNELHSVRDFLNKAESSVKRQVVLETKILEVRLNEGFESGINWGAISGQLSLSQNNRSSGSLSDIIFDNGGGVESLISTVLNVTDITKLLFLLEQQGSVQVLSSPRISTLNNQKALIRVGTDEFFVTGISNSTTSSASSIVNTPEVELDSFFSGIALDVTPQISENGDVILHVHPMVTTVTDQTKKIDVAGEVFSLPLALRNVRESDSIVRARSGQVVVLGGLMQEKTSDVDTKRGFLGDIPIVKWFFKAKQKTKIKTELVILMQPIVVDENTWQSQLKAHAGRIQGLSDEFRAR